MSSLPGSWGGGTHSLILLLCLAADDLFHVVGREPKLLLAPVVPPPPARGERIKASGQISGRGGQGCPCCMRCQGVVGEGVGWTEKEAELKPAMGCPLHLPLMVTPK